MKTTPYVEPPEGGKDLFDALHAMVKLSRWAYEKALEEGFTPNQSMELAKTLISATMAASTGK